MNFDITKEKILELKSTLNVLVKKKTQAAALQNWEAAAGFRDEEKIMSDYLQTLKNEITEELKNLKQLPLENNNDIILLEELLVLIDT